MDRLRSTLTPGRPVTPAGFRIHFCLVIPLTRDGPEGLLGTARVPLALPYSEFDKVDGGSSISTVPHSPIFTFFPEQAETRTAPPAAPPCFNCPMTTCKV